MVVDRRRFLAGAAGIGVAGTTAALLGLPTGTTEVKHHLPPPATTTPAPPDNAPWNQLARALKGRLVRPADASYRTDRQLYNTKFSNRAPQGIAYCTSSADVARCLDFIQRHGLAVTARSGGHSYGGYSTCDGLVIDVTACHQIEVDPARRTARVGAGARLIDLYDTIGATGLLLPGGSCPTVGIAGLALGGGVGVFARAFGLTCDHLTAAEVVLPDSTTVTASPAHHADLFWGLQGGGGGNFGISTSFTFSLDPMPPLSLFTLQFPFDAAVEVLGAWQQWVDHQPPELWSNCLVLSEGAAGLRLEVNGVCCTSASTTASLLGALTSVLSVAPTYRFVGDEAYLHAMAVEAGCADLTAAACHLETQNPAGRLQRSAYSATSSYLEAPMGTGRLEAVVAWVRELASTHRDLGGGFAFDAYGGVINEVAPDATAFVHRNKLCGIQATISWGSGASSAEIESAAAWLKEASAQVYQPSMGAYQNYIDPLLTEWAHAYYGTNLTRLSAIKTAYDPTDVLGFSQAIPR